ncbi:RNA polymerase subunit sigma [Idiomarina tyrosinivorans]|uniref:RNA polymerase subunit sigma n=1 Tax=Idiomarina tyrosinivorans TaxID=1445662 RepID=A0A432ZQ43_9GAMM|nr:sigma-70 family RNA polymerase sigma factor [Idiomarina tyrosinivorans]RUO79962.1 RNA polymerase subunit sigma [Idiomarina tyrosinivorans]
MNELTLQVAAAAQGDQQAYAKVVARTQNLVASVALGIVKDVRASEEVAQEAFILAWQKLGQLRRHASFLPWLRQMTRHCAYQWLEKEHPGRYQLMVNINQELEAQFDSDQPDTPEQQLSRDQQAQFLRQALDTLPDDTRDVVVLYYREQQSSQQVAELLGLSSAVVRQRLSRARGALAETLMKRVGKAALFTAPSLSVSAILGSSLTFASPPVAAAGWGAASSAGGFKWLAILGIYALALFGALAGIFIGSHQAQKWANTDADKAGLRRLRNQAAIFVVLAGGLFISSYQIDDGWVMPVVTYCIFLAGIVLYQRKVQRHITCPANKRWQCYLGYTLGLGGGTFGLVMGLVQSGRLTF